MELYEKLWQEAATALARGEPQLDSRLLDKKNDLRRGVTLLIRPPSVVRDDVKHYLDRLSAVCPEQYFYRPEELHVTVLSIISGTEHWRKEISRLAACRAIISEVLGRQHSFWLGFRGVTATPGSVMIQGFPVGDGLSIIRDKLRTAFADAGLGGTLDRRYKISAAHMTALRFRQSGIDWKRLLPLLEEGRQIDFGQMEVTRLQLIWGDWYASANIVRVLQEYELTGSPIGSGPMPA